jgi:23S rRNA pseudouridine955/2504/2580 synthase
VRHQRLPSHGEGLRRAPSKLLLQVQPAEAGLLLLRFCVQRGGIAEAEARAAIERGGAYVEGARVKDPARQLAAKERVELHLRERGEAPQEAPALERTRLLYLDGEVALVDKPAGVLAQEGRAGGPDLPALVGGLLAGRRERSQALLVHRLDRGTTGVCALARTRAAQAWMLAAFREGRVKKEYAALCLDTRPEGERASDLQIDLPLGPDLALPGRRKPDPLGEPAQTRARIAREWVLGAGAHCQRLALVEAFPATGRTHQVRVHLSARGLPLLGDGRYGGPAFLTAPDGARLELSRPMLHARRLSIERPGKGAVAASAPEPQDFTEALRFLGRTGAG